MPQTRQRKGRETRGLNTSNVDLKAAPTSNSIRDPGATEPDMTASSSVLGALRRQPVWIVLAVSSGTCAAFNGVFAKLTTTALTSTLSSHISLFFSLSPTNHFVEFLVRGTFFLLNLAFNAAMWALFTAALRRGDSATRVSIINVSANFMVTAILGWMIFSEKLNGIWWGGAALLAAGNVIIGRREEGEKQRNADNEFGGSARQSEDAERLLGTTGEETLLELDDEPEQRRKSNDELSRLMRAEEADAPL
ncbi:hypothetical protein, variant [Exophiala mesophila]|uniref:EamA domain-containing protein n=1 Tax=Exophiala mesophila TaxID=212818 RepID=A0A0D1Y0F1_EXOME|nr:uncharacterized protein PV10_05135 [Exophiala mesophila]XP_016225540.1 hypothetical protein, variant [Exophiala mesophila]KIV93965.1 hypothetical protein PV10_05135 [Exophiala mesophila]KIV93966.1 hypothetical protein, variant [Exophiala mesophila]